MSNCKHAFDCDGEPGLMKALWICKWKVFEPTFSDSKTAAGHKHKLCSTLVKINMCLRFKLVLTLVEVY